MTASFRHTFWLLLGLGGGFFLFSLEAAPPAPVSQTAGAATPTPPVPVLKSPVDSFRTLLKMSPDDRNHELANRPPGIRQRILEKVKEYEAMKPEDRELRLRLTQLRWYMLRTVQLPRSEREPQLAALSAEDRQSINNRLEQWDLLPVDEQKRVLQYEQTMEQLADQNLNNGAKTNKAIAATPVPGRENELKNLDNFLKLPPEQREVMSASFQRFFELTDDERQKTIAALPPTQRAHLAEALKMFAKLPKAERDECFKALRKFSSMSDEERQQFSKNVQRWRELPPAEREAWRVLVYGLPPLPNLPAGMGYPPLPPLPHQRPVQQASLPVSTNASP